MSLLFHVPNAENCRRWLISVYPQDKHKIKRYTAKKAKAVYISVRSAYEKGKNIFSKENRLQKGEGGR
jgi:ABC-type transporter lipoprotein component MlaA